MAFAVLAATNNSETTTNTTSHSVALPAGISAGHLLKVEICFAANVTATLPSGWAAKLVENTDANGCLWVIYKFADGSEGSTLTVTSSANSTASHLSERWTGMHASAAPEVGTVTVVGNVTSHDPSSVTPSWAQDDTVYQALFGWRNAARTVSTWPTNYTDNQTTKNNSGGGNQGALGFATRNLNATSDDPGAMTLSAASVGKCVTIAIRPAAATAIDGSLTVTEASDTVSSAGAVAIAGTLTKTEANDTLSSAGALAIQGSASITEARDTLSAAGTDATTGSASITEANDTVSATAALALAASASITEANDTLSSASALAIAGSLSRTEAGDTLSSTAVLVKAGGATITEQPDTLVSAARLEIHAIAALIEAGDILVSAATVPIVPSMNFSVGAVPGLTTSVVRGASLNSSIQSNGSMGGTVQRSAGMTGSVQRNVTQRQSVRQ